MQRQIFFGGVGDYDTHGEQASRYPRLMSELNHSLNSLYSVTVELGIADKVTIFTATDFGRIIPTTSMDQMAASLAG